MLFTDCLDPVGWGPVDTPLGAFLKSFTLCIPDPFPWRLFRYVEPQIIPMCFMYTFVVYMQGPT